VTRSINVVIDAHQEDNDRTAVRLDGWLPQDGIVILEGAVGSLGCGTEGMQFTIAFRASGFHRSAGGAEQSRRGWKSRGDSRDVDSFDTAPGWQDLWTSRNA
jgi:hypothetical protein